MHFPCTHAYTDVQTGRNAFYYPFLFAIPSVIKSMLLYAQAFGLLHPHMLPGAIKMVIILY
jgi:hypothetical protein